MAATQQNRLLSIATPLGEDHLLLSRMNLREGISELFECEVELLHEETGDRGRSEAVRTRSEFKFQFVLSRSMAS